MADPEALQLDVVEHVARGGDRVHGDGVEVGPGQDFNGQPGHAVAFSASLHELTADAARAHLEIPESVDGHCRVGREKEVLAAIVHQHAFLVAHDSVDEDELPRPQFLEAAAQFLRFEIVPVGEADGRELVFQCAQGLVGEQVGDGLIRADDHEFPAHGVQGQGRVHGLGKGRVLGQTGDAALAAQLLGPEVVHAAEDHGRSLKDAVPVAEHEIEGVVVRGHDEIKGAFGKLVSQKRRLEREVGGVRVALGVQVFDPQQRIWHFGAKCFVDARIEGVGPGQARMIGVQHEHVWRGGLQVQWRQDQRDENYEADHEFGVSAIGAGFKYDACCP